MSGLIEGQGGHGKGGSQDFELNLAPIIDCMTVLITFMLASASFLSIGILDAGVAAGATTASDQTPPAITVAIELGHEKNFLLKVSGKENKSFTIPYSGANAPAYDYASLNQQLTQLGSRYPNVKAVTLSADNGVEYEDVVKAMDSIRKTMPVVLLGGF
jgi:biopolymer transport protein ExbD